MQRVGLWHVTEEGPKKLKGGGIEFEQYLEEWIERDPSLLQGGLTIVGRQIAVEGGRIDLLALDPQGRWVVIEIKRGTVHRETIAQALDYAACIATMPYDELSRKVDAYLRTTETSLRTLAEEPGAEDDTQRETRDVVMFVVGTGRDPGLERMVEYLSGTFNVPINLVTYEVFEVEGGQRILVRELADVELGAPARIEKVSITVEDVCAQAEQTGIGREFRMLLEAARRHNLYPRPYKRSVMYTPPSNRTRMLFTVRARPKPNGLLRMYVGPGAFAEFYPVTEETATSILGPDGWREMTASDVEAFITSLDRLFESSVPHDSTEDAT